MKPPTEATCETRPFLRTALARVHFRLILFAVGLTGLTVMLFGFAVMRDYARHNLQLIAQSVAYTVEAAMVFDDRDAAAEALAVIGAAEAVAEVSAVRRDGTLLASWRRGGGGFVHQVEGWVAGLVFPSPIMSPVVHGGAAVGQIRLRGASTGLVKFVAGGLAGAFVCLIAAAITSVHLARHLQHSIVGPLQTLARVAHTVRRDRAFGQRVPPAKIAEINALGDDFNALLGELETWHGRLQRENAALTHLATHDSLTGLPNRAYFEGRLSRAIRDAQGTGERVAVLFLDSDRFKETNDAFGHAAGDVVLATIAARIKGQLREFDLVARLGGDEFAILLTPIGDIDDAVRVADDIIASMEQPVALPAGDAVRATLSIGISLFPEHARDATGLLDTADAAMYAAKQLSRGGRQVAKALKESPTGREGGRALHS